MITCKEDLINTYVKNTPELRREFLSTAVKFGLVGREQEVSESSDDDAVVAYWHDVDRENLTLGCWSIYSNRIKEECRELTLSDLKPRTKTSYEKVESVDSGDRVFVFVHGDESWAECLVIGWHPEHPIIIVESHQGLGTATLDEVHCKLENPIEWWEDLVECIDNTTDGSGYAESIKGEKLHVNASMTRDQWCDFARILLEQGE